MGKIGNIAFSYCSSLKDITIRGSVTSTGSYELHQCSKLWKVIIREDYISYDLFGINSTSCIHKVIDDSITKMHKFHTVKLLYINSNLIFSQLLYFLYFNLFYCYVCDLIIFIITTYAKNIYSTKFKVIV